MPYGNLTVNLPHAVLADAYLDEATDLIEHREGYERDSSWSAKHEAQIPHVAVLLALCKLHQALIVPVPDGVRLRASEQR